ncbi:hypothetical protein ACWC5I_28180, partial [Kitasatospora sp. NPDC001574]
REQPYQPVELLLLVLRRGERDRLQLAGLPALGRVLAETGYVGVGERCGELEVALGALIAGLVRRG